MTESRTPRPHRPEPIGWGAVEPLAGRAQTIAKGWLLLLLERAPLDAVGTIPAAALAAEGPALCAAVVRGLGSDAELARLGPGGDLAALVGRVGPLCGAADAAATVAAVDALRACVWVAALELRAGERDPHAVGELADRLAAVTAVVTATALAGVVVAPAQTAPAQTAPAQPAPPPYAAPAPPPRAAPAQPPHAAPAQPPYGAPAAPPQPAPPQPVSAPPHAAAPQPVTPQAPAPPRDEAPSPPPEPAWAQDDAAPATHDGIPHGQGAPQPADDAGEPAWSHPEPALDDLRDGVDDHGSVTSLPARPAVDPRHGPAAAMDDSDLWIATLERHIDRCQREGGGLALLRVELVDGDRVAASAPDGQAHVPYGRLAQAVRRAIRRQDLVASDHHGRAWVIAPGVGRAGAIALAERIGAGVESGEQWRGAPLAATIGFAVYGEDGHDAATLIDRAEEAMLAATAAGAPIGEALPHPEGEGGDPDRPGPRLVR